MAEPGTYGSDESIGPLRRFFRFLRKYENALVASAVIVWVIWMGVHYSWDEKLISASVLLVALLGQLFAALGAWIAVVPVIGPLVVKVLTLPLIWVLNGIGYIVSVIAIKRGYTKEILNTRVVAVVLLIGITIGYILGKLV